MHSASDRDRRLRKYSEMADKYRRSVPPNSTREKKVSPERIEAIKRMSDHDLEGLIADHTGYLGKPATEIKDSLLALQYAEDRYGVIVKDYVRHRNNNRWIMYDRYGGSMTVTNLPRAICIEIVKTVAREEEIEL